MEKPLKSVTQSVKSKSKCLKKTNSVDVVISSHKHCRSEENGKASNFWTVKKVSAGRKLRPEKKLHKT